jgi:hypothetical protein
MIIIWHNIGTRETFCQFFRNLVPSNSQLLSDIIGTRERFCQNCQLGTLWTSLLDFNMLFYVPVPMHFGEQLTLRISGWRPEYARRWNLRIWGVKAGIYLELTLKISRVKGGICRELTLRISRVKGGICGKLILRSKVWNVSPVNPKNLRVKCGICPVRSLEWRAESVRN